MEYSIDVKIGEVTMTTDPRVAKRFAEQMAKQDPRFFRTAEFVDTQQPEQVVGLDNV